MLVPILLFAVLYIQCRFGLPFLVMSCRVVSFTILFWYVLFPIVLSRFALLCCAVSSLVVSGLAFRSVLCASLGWLYLVVTLNVSCFWLWLW